MNKTNEIYEIRYNIQALEQERIQNLFQNRLGSKFTRTEFSSLEEQYEHMKECNNFLIGKHKNNSTKLYFWDEEVAKGVADKRRKYYDYLPEVSNDNRQGKEIREAQVRVRKLISKENEYTYI